MIVLTPGTFLNVLPKILAFSICLHVIMISSRLSNPFWIHENAEFDSLMYLNVTQKAYQHI